MKKTLANTSGLTGSEKELLWLAGYDAFGERPFVVPSHQREYREFLRDLGLVAPVASLTADGAWKLTPAGHRRVKKLVPTYDLPDHALESPPSPDKLPETMPIRMTVSVALRPWQASSVLREWAERTIPEFRSSRVTCDGPDSKGEFTLSTTTEVRVPAPKVTE